MQKMSPRKCTGYLQYITTNIIYHDIKVVTITWTFVDSVCLPLRSVKQSRHIVIKSNIVQIKDVTSSISYSLDVPQIINKLPPQCQWCVLWKRHVCYFIIYQCYVYRTNIRHIPPEVAWECDTTSVIR